MSLPHKLSQKSQECCRSPAQKTYSDSATFKSEKNVYNLQNEKVQLEYMRKSRLTQEAASFFAQ